MKKITCILLFVLTCIVHANGSILVEAESFTDKGGWVVDQQFVEQMGSPYLLAHGLGRPVADCSTFVDVAQKGTYEVWVRTKNWAAGNWVAPGRFSVSINGTRLKNQLGAKSPEWGWEYAGAMFVKQGNVKIALHDATGFDGRCDAVYLTLRKNAAPPHEKEALSQWRKRLLPMEEPAKVVEYDFVVVGGGIAGCAAAIAAAEQGLRVAVIHDRSVLGGNASSEVRVHTLGIYGKFERILRLLDTEHYPNGSELAVVDEKKRMTNMAKYELIDLYLNYRALGVEVTQNRISSVDAKQTATGELLRFKAPYFVDSTGDGWIGYWAGCEYRYGREEASEYGEQWDKYGQLWSPDQRDNSVMGSSLLWRSVNVGRPVVFPTVPWAMDVARNYAEKNGEWQWELSKNELNQVDDAEQIRDYMLRAIYGSFYNYKNHLHGAHIKKAPTTKTAKGAQHASPDSLDLEWVGYVLGKRESRRLMGDYVYSFKDVRELTKFEDAVVFEKRAVDVHYQIQLLDKTEPDFLSEAMFYNTKEYQIPYRSLYSKDVKNLFMAGRNFSCTHIGLSGPRVMNTTGQMGAAVGIAASLCKRYGITPREVYAHHLKEYLALIEAQR